LGDLATSLWPAVGDQSQSNQSGAETDTYARPALIASLVLLFLQCISWTGYFKIFRWQVLRWEVASSDKVTKSKYWAFGPSIVAPCVCVLLVCLQATPVSRVWIVYGPLNVKVGRALPWRVEHVALRSPAAPAEVFDSRVAAPWSPSCCSSSPAAYGWGLAATSCH
jgi:hypothetical protein